MERRRAIERFEENYAYVPAGTGGHKRGGYVYCGPWYFWTLSPAQLSGKKLRWAALLAVQIAGCAVAGLARRAAGGAVLEVPALLALIALITELYGSVLFLKNGLKLRRPDFQQIRLICRAAPAIFAALMLISGTAGCVTALTAGRNGDLWPAFAALLGAATAACMPRVVASIGFRSEKNEFRL